MNLALNILANRALLWHHGASTFLTELESREFPAVTPEPLFPRLGRVRLGGGHAAQHTGRTCGTAVLALANALFDPDLRAHLRVEGSDVPARERSALARARFAEVQDSLLTAATGLSWPAVLGTPPWGLARELRVPGVAYEHLPVDDRNAALTEVLTGALQRATAAGIPVPLYAGGNTSGGLARAVPRHVVLLLPPSAVVSAPASDHARIYEPASGRVFRRSWARLWNRSKPESAFGGWTHVAWAILPRASRSDRVTGTIRPVT